MIRRLLISGSAIWFALPSVAGELPAPGEDGWHSWRVAAVEGAPSWCCGTWNRGIPTATSCTLDGRDSHVDDDQRFPGEPVEMQVYAHVENGSATEVRTYDARCPVVGDIVDHGSIDAEASVRWLDRFAVEQARSHTMMSIATHDGSFASDMLERYASPGEPLETRKDALFWISQLRSDDSRDVLFDTIKRDDEPAILDQAVFAISQLPGSAATEGLLGIIEDRSLSRDVREQALFWLAQSDSPDAWAFIDRLLTR